MKRGITLSLVAVMSMYAADSTEQLGLMSIVGDKESHANNLVDKSKIEVTNSVGNPLLLLNNVAGVHVTSGSTFGLYEYANQVNMRGFNQSQIASLVDGVPLGSSATAGGAPVNRFVEPENLSSVTVHQGSGALSTPSASALGGSINYATTLPTKDTGIKVETTTGSFGSKKTFARVDTGEFAKDSRAYLSVSETTTDKWKSQGELKREHLEGKLLTKVADVDLQLNMSYNNRKDHDYLDITKEQYETFGRDFDLNDAWVNDADKAKQTAQNAYYWDTWQNARTDTLVSLNARTDLGAGELKITPYYHDQEGTGSWAPNYVINPDGSKDYTKQSYRESQYFTQRYGMTLNWAMDIGNHELLAGLWGEEGSRQNKRYWFNVLNQDVSWTHYKTPYLEQFNRNFDTTSLMAYLQTKLHFLNDDLIVDLGAKTQKTSVTYTDNKNAANSQPAKDSTAPFLPQAGATYKLDAQNQLFTSFAMNYAQLPDSIYTGTSYDPDIENEKSLNVDLGYRLNMPQTSLTAALFYVKYTNKIENITAGAGDIFDVGQSYAKNVGGVKSKGLELTGLYELTSAWKLSGTYTYTNAQYSDNVGTLLISGKQVPFLPKHMITLGLDFNKDGYLFGVNAKANKEIYGTRDNSDKIDDYILTNFYMGYRKNLTNALIKNVDVMLNVDNAFDTDYLATAGAFGDTLGSSTYFVGSPRTVALKLSATF